MLSDFEIITHHFPNNYDLTIFPISDVHLGASEHMGKEWEDFCRKVEETPNAYIVLGGDLINNSTRTSVANVFEETMRPREQKKVIAEMLMPLRNRILCAVSGNHERRSGKDADDDPTYDIMCKLDIEHLYRENMAFVKLQIGSKDGDGRRNPTYMLTVTHGAGGGRKEGAKAIRLADMASIVDTDIYVHSHTHLPMVMKQNFYRVDTCNSAVAEIPKLFVNTSAQLKYGGYGQTYEFKPSNTTSPVIYLSGIKKEFTARL